MLKEKIKSFITDGFINKSLKVLLLRVGGVILFFSLSLFLTNFFPAEYVGRYDFSRSILLIVGGLCLLGTDQAIIYFSGALASKNELGELKDVYKKMMTMVLGMSIGLLLIVWCIPKEWLLFFFEKDDAPLILLKTIATLTGFTITLLNIDALRALQKPLFSELYRNIFRHLAFLLLAIGLFILDLKSFVVEAFLLSFALLAITSSVLVYREFRKYKDYQPKGSYSYKNIFSRSYPMALSSISYFLMQSVDIVLLGKFTTFETVAYYAVAVKVAVVTSLVLLSVNIVLAPKIAEFHTQKDLPSLREVVKKSARLILFLSIPAIVILSVFSEFTLHLFGENFVLAKEALWILLAGQLVKSLCGPIAIYLNMTGRQKILQQILFLALFINIALNWYLIPKHGMMGAAIATTISIVFWNLVSVIYVYRKDKIKTFIS